MLFLLLACALLVGSAVRKSATVDEQSHLFRGVAYLTQGETRFLLGHPLGASALAALPLLTEPDLALPLESAAWAAGNWSVAGDQFLWRLNPNPQRLIFLGRLPTIWLTLLLGALVFRWGRQAAGGHIGLAALVLVLFDPTVLAHGRLITGDLALTFGFTLTLYGAWRWIETGRHTGWIMTGSGLGLASLSKYSAAVLLPVLLLLVVGAVWQRRATPHRWRPFGALLAAGLLAGGLIVVAYRLALTPLPGGAFWDDLFWQWRYTGRGHGQYLFGRLSADGWWYYFPVAFLLKTPLPTLLLFAAGAVALPRAWQRTPRLVAVLALPILIYLPLSMATALNIGVRYLLPLLPLFVLLALVALQSAAPQHPRLRHTFWAAPLAVLLTSLAWWPDYIPYFNLAAGPPQQRWRLLSDSNIDWGQDLPALAAWQRETGRPLHLAWFGTAHPSAYGVPFTPLPTWPAAPEQGDPARQPYNPADPAPGFYAISVTNLHGAVLGAAGESYAWFREREPLARIGGSLFLYEVAPTGPPVAVAFSGVRPGTLAADLHALWQSNDVRPRWFSAETAWLQPSGGGWAALADSAVRWPELAAFRPDQPLAVVGSQMLYRLEDGDDGEKWGAESADFGPLLWRGVQFVAPLPGELALLTLWEAREGQGNRPIALFIHALDADGEIVTQWDGLDLAGWQAGDRLVQGHSLWLPEGAAVTELLLGVYDPQTGERSGEPVRVPLPPHLP